jgi:uncharacterized membrane protein
MKMENRIARDLGWFSMGLGLTGLVATEALARFLGTERKTLLRFCGLRELAAGVGILSRPQPAGWMWSRVAGDALDLASLACLLSSRRPHPVNAAVATAAVAGVTALDIWCAAKLSDSLRSPLHVQKTITVGRAAAELYEFWRDPEKLAAIMGHVATVIPAGEDRTHWTLRAPAPRSVSWHARYVDEKPGELLRWHSEDGDVETDGTVRFAPAPGDHGTEVTLNFRFIPQGWRRAITAATLLGMVPEVLTIRALRRFKSLAETGELPTLEKNPAARSGATANLI